MAKDAATERLQEDDSECDGLMSSQMQMPRRPCSGQSCRKAFVLSIGMASLAAIALVGLRSSWSSRQHDHVGFSLANSSNMLGRKYDASRTWQPHFLDDHENAVCNDGSPAAYYYRAGVANQKTTIVFLQGAGWCWSDISCKHPWHAKMGTSHLFPRTPEAIETWANSLEGLFDFKGSSPIDEYNVAFVRTCSNDAFMGDRGPTHPGSAPGSGWHFRGKAIVDAAFNDLQTRYGLGRSEEDRVVFGGCSSGGRGAMVSLDYVAKNLIGKASIAGLLDSPLWVPIDPLVHNFVSFSKQTRLFFDYANAQTVITPECEAAYPGEDRWKCLMGAFMLPYVKSPYFMTHSQYDLFSVSMNALGSFSPFVPLNARQKEYAGKYRQMLLHYLPNPPQDSGKTVFSTATYNHCALMSHIFWTVQADGIGLSHVLQQWLPAVFGQHTSGYIVDRCEGFNCGKLLKSPHFVDGRPVSDAAQGPEGQARSGSVSMTYPIAGIACLLAEAMLQLF